MAAFFTDILYKMLIGFMSFCALFGSMNPPATNDPIKSLHPDVNLTAVMWGDPQIADYMYSRFQYCKNSSIDISNASEPIDAFVIAGDITENGKATEYRALLDDFKLIDGKIKNYVLAVGNHDVRLRNYKQVKNSFTDFYKDTNILAGNGDTIDELSYTKVINGYSFIVLGPTKSAFEESYFDDARLQWFEDELIKASRSGLPIFVVCHQPLKLTHNLPAAWGSPLPNAGSVGPQNDRLRDILNNFDNLIFITGHLHSGFSEYSYEKIDNFHGVNLPAIGPHNAGGLEESGIGYIMEVYDDEVIFRARSFAEGKYLPQYDINIELK